MFLYPISNQWFFSKSTIHHCVKSVRIRTFSGPYFSHSGWRRDQKIPKYGRFSRSALHRHNLPYTSASPLSHISSSIILIYLCVIVGTLPQPLTLTRKFSGPICKSVSNFSSQVYQPSTLFMAPFLLHCRDLDSEVLAFFFKVYFKNTLLHQESGQNILIPSLYLKTHHPT